MIIYRQREHAKGVIVIFGNVFGENDLKIVWRECFNARIVGYIIIIVPVGELIVEGIAETDKSKHADNREDNCLFCGE